MKQNSRFVLTRRALLTSVAVAALLSRSSFAQLAADQVPPAAFGGNPNIRVTAIETSGGIVISRTQGQFPAFVQVSASVIKAAGTDKPYEDLEYHWDFGDPNGKEIFVRPTDGISVNANTQSGPEAAYCYRAPGTYTITLTVRGIASIDGNGKPTYISKTLTARFTAEKYRASGGEYWFDSNYDGSKGPANGSQSSPYSSFDDLKRFFHLENVFIHLKRGSVWSVSDNKYLTAHGPLRVDAYGTGPKPKLTASGSNVRPVLFIYQSRGIRFSDMVFSNLHVSHASTVHVSGAITVRQGVTTSGHNMYDIYFDNVDAEVEPGFASKPWALSYYTTTKTNDLPGAFRWGLWNCTAKNSLTPSGCGGSFFGGSKQWFFIYGGRMEGAGSSKIRDHHIYPECVWHHVYRWIAFGKGPLKNFCFNGNIAHTGYPLGTVGRWQLISECDMTGTQNGIDVSDSYNSTDCLFDDFVVERNRIHDLARFALISYSGLSVTFRDNLVWNLGKESAVIIPSPQVKDILSLKVYRNKIFTAGAAVSGGYYKPGWTKPLVFTDNVAYVTSKRGTILDVFPDDLLASPGTIIDRNQYWTPSGEVKMRDAGATVTFAQWQAQNPRLDPHSVVADPKWVDPAKGQFNK